MENIFLDANIMADWLLISPEILKIKDENQKVLKLKEIWKNYTSPRVCFEILERLRYDRIKNTKFFTSELALSELGDVIFKELRSKALSARGVAFRYIPKMIKNLEPADTEVTDILKRVKSFRDIFVKDKVEVHDNLRDPLLALYLLTVFRIETYDAYLISQAVDAKCRYFVTKDKELRDSLKVNVIKLISPEELVKLLG
jgi:predicted nucleic acid-binding protein